jgi:hypothetical protein
LIGRGRTIAVVGVEDSDGTEQQRRSGAQHWPAQRREQPSCAATTWRRC